MRSASGNRQTYCDLLSLFGELHATSAGKLDELHLAGDLGGLKKHAHSLKGSAATLAISEVAAAASSLEKLAHSGDAGKLLSEAVSQLQDALECHFVQWEKARSATLTAS